MIIDFYLITGLMAGFEYVEIDGEDDIEKGIVIDLFLVRIMFLW